MLKKGLPALPFFPGQRSKEMIFFRIVLHQFISICIRTMVVCTLARIKISCSHSGI